MQAMAPFDEIELGGPPVAACSKVRVPSGLRSGRAPGRERSSSRGGRSGRASLCLGRDEPRGRSLTRDFEYEELVLPMSRLTAFEVPGLCDDAFQDQLIGEDMEDLDAGDSWDDCASDFIGGLIAGAVDDYSDEAVFLMGEANGEAFMVIESEAWSPEVIDVLHSTSHTGDSCEAKACETVDSDCVPTSNGHDCEAEEVDSNYDANSDCRDYPDSEFPEDDDIWQPAHSSHSGMAALSHGIFSKYVSDMFKVVLSGDVADYFTAADEGNRSSESSLAAEKIPPSGSLLPCSRPICRRRLRPREIPQRETFAMDCLPSKPVVSKAVEAKPVEFWAEQLERAAVAEQVFNESLALSLQFELETKDKTVEPLLGNDVVAVPVAPSVPKPQGIRPKSFQRSYQCLQPSTARPPSTPRTRRMLAEPACFQSPSLQDSLPLQPDTGSTPILNYDALRPPMSPSPPVTGSTPIVNCETLRHTMSPSPPVAPPPCLSSHARKPSPRRQDSPRTSSINAPAKPSKLKSPRPSSLDAPAALSKLKLHDGGTIRFLSPRSPAEALPRPALADTSQSPAISAMSLDLGGDLASSSKESRFGLHSHRELSNERVSKTNVYNAETRPYGFLPPIVPASWGGIEADIGTHAVAWKAHDVI